jgi:hypothetical protein
MKGWDSRDWVAFILAVCLLFPFLAAGIADVVISFRGSPLVDGQGYVEINKVLGDLMKVMAGGLIGFIAGRNNNGKTRQDTGTD